MLSAHLDHLGVGEPIAGDAVYNGAMDNASGVAALLEVARSFKVRPRRSLVFAFVTGEEKGLLGSRMFAERPPLGGRFVADVNVDMFMPLHPMKFRSSSKVGPCDLARLGLLEVGWNGHATGSAWPGVAEFSPPPAHPTRMRTPEGKLCARRHVCKPNVVSRSGVARPPPSLRGSLGNATVRAELPPSH